MDTEELVKLTVSAWDNAVRAQEESRAVRSFDAKVWASEFVGYVKDNPAIATDTETMTAWFAGALMRGYDEASKAIRKG